MNMADNKEKIKIGGIAFVLLLVGSMAGVASRLSIRGLGNSNSNNGSQLSYSHSLTNTKIKND